MKVLGIETSGNTGGVAVYEEKHVITTRDFRTGMHHGKELIPSIRDVLNEIGRKPDDIDLIAVDVGPGSYTGLRIGVTCAKTLAYALNKPVIGVPVFDIMAELYTPVSIAQQIHDSVSLPAQGAEDATRRNLVGDEDVGKEYYLCPVLDARRKHVYACIYKCVPLCSEHGLTGIQKNKLSEFLVIQPRDLISILPRPVIVFGDGVQPYREVFHQKDIFIDNDEPAAPKAVHVALLGEKLYEAGQRCGIDKLLPLYLRRAEANKSKE